MAGKVRARMIIRIEHKIRKLEDRLKYMSSLEIGNGLFKQKVDPSIHEEFYNFLFFKSKYVS